jgi:hypothetical protein
VRLRLFCPVCETAGDVALPGPGSWPCPTCHHVVPIHDPQGDPALPACAACGNPELYKKKDFPHALGMGIIVGAFVPATIFYCYYQVFWAWVFLLGSFAIDAILYLLVADVVTCYRCNAEHRGVPSLPHHLPHEQTTQEKYRQERLRREEIERAARR